MIKIFISVVLGFIVFCNLYVAHTMTEDDMFYDFIISQGVLGTIFANTFYALAWALKGIKKIVK